MQTRREQCGMRRFHTMQMRFLLGISINTSAPIRSGISGPLKKKRRGLVTPSSRVVDRLPKDKSKLTFMTN